MYNLHAYDVGPAHLRFVTNDIEFTPEVMSTVQDIRSDTSPFNWAVCGYDNSDIESSTQRMIVVEKGMGIGGITSVLEEGSTMYIYLRVDVPLHRGTERIVSKYVLVTWQGVESGWSGGTSDDEVELWFGPGSNGERSPQRRDSFASSSKLQRAVTAHVHASGDTQAPVCLEIPFDATVGVLRQEIASNIGIPKDRQHSQLSTAVMLEDENAGIRKDIGLAHGDKIHVDDKDNGENSVLAKLFEQINAGAATVSLSAERRHEVQRGVEAREAELRKILSVTHYLIRRKASEDLKPVARMTEVVEEAVSRETKEADSVSPMSQHKVVHRADSSASLTASISEELAKEDVSTLQEQARVLESQNQYLEIPYESIHILSGKENELGCGKAATDTSKEVCSRIDANQVLVFGRVAPEVLLDEDLGYSFKADNWSFAIVMWEMIAGGLQNPFIGMAPIKFYNKTINAGIRPPIPEGVDSEYIDLITECWKSDAADRPSFDVIVARLEQMLLALGASIDLPPTFQGGYHQAGTAANP
ncbi:unnamed protein product [Phytophthora fragariaefolia]|uniref:Unnamed protein product n=1 Tax=Phytophthora fragariaefolia TaxID=1490495 RepID=A0A9W6TK73_9STRA|nr:unnamed protein product [Phytophthora fragariaefolia]